MKIIFEYILHPILLFTLRISSLPSLLNDAYSDTIDDENFFQFSLEVELASPLYVHITLVTDSEVGSPCFSQLLQC